MYRAIQQAIVNLENNLTIAEIKDLLENDQSFLCGEYRPDFSEKLESFSDEVGLIIGDITDGFWIALLCERYTKQSNH